jgi:GNAT superfamily N-acetyltransferase
MIHCIRTNSGNVDFQKLVSALDADLKIRDGEEHSYYAQFNKIDKIKHVVVTYHDELPVGCGALKEYAPDAMEVKRMFVLPAYRGRGIASVVLKELEAWAGELNYARCVLETGKRQPEAIALYTKNAYRVIPNYGQYEQVENSVCFEKKLQDNPKDPIEN